MIGGSSHQGRLSTEPYARDALDLSVRGEEDGIHQGPARQWGAWSREGSTSRVVFAVVSDNIKASEKLWVQECPGCENGADGLVPVSGFHPGRQ